MGFTNEQQAVIDARNSNVLVSAAAGSGKTTVLVERIIQRITGDKPIDIDRLLVVTFTKAAAAQMKEKILKAIQKKLTEEPNNAHLQRQETLVHGAQITTIDSFCQYIIRNNFNDIDLDPSYRVGDEGEMKLLRGDVLEELLEDKYAEGEEAFLNCTEYFATGNNDKKLEEFILQLYDYAMSMPFPEEWLEERMADYRLEPSEFENAFFVKRCMDTARQVLLECKERYEIALHLANEPDGPYFYADLLEKELEYTEKILSKEDMSFNELRAEILDFIFDKLPGKRDSSINTDKREVAKSHRDYAKKQMGSLAEKYFAEDKDTILAHMKLVEEPVACLANLAIEFKHRFDEKKREKGIIDFGDMEHLALNILIRKKENGEYEPTNTALQYRDYFEEVMIDEYQDSNNVQEMLLSAVSGEASGRFNRFMVGDVKQSIYKFRLARPEIFMEKMGTYSLDETADKRKISLHNNFRSRRDVLDSVNYIFEQIMGTDLGGVKYDEDAALVTGAKFPEPENEGDYATEFIFANTEGLKSQKAKELEAKMVAQRIDELMKTAKVKDGDSETDLRPINFSDIVILLRATNGWDDIFKKALDERGIPAYIESKTGYFKATEVVTLLNVLNVLSNPKQDIPLVSVMHSVIGGFTDEELAVIKAHDREVEKTILDGDSFYDILTRYQNEPATIDEALCDKIHNFIEKLSLFREKSSYLPVSELLKFIFEETGYYQYNAALPQGEIRAGNLNMLVEKAMDYEKTSFKGLFHFVRYIEQLAKYEVDYGEAGMLDENANVVRIMSIHKSKGLEFPIVFVSGMAKEFNYMDVNSSVVSDMDLGIGTHAIDLKRRIKYKTLRKSVIDDYMKTDILGEEMRILYVAMTRAKEKLIMSGQIKRGEDDVISSSDIRSIISDLLRYRKREALEGEQPYLMPLFKRNSALSYQTLVLMALARHPDFIKLAELVGAECDEVSSDQGIPVTAKQGEFVGFDFRLMKEEEILGAEVGAQIGGGLRLNDLESVLSADEEDLKSFYIDRFGSKYGHEALNKLFIKTTVTELKKAKLEEETEPAQRLISEETYVPSFISKPDEVFRGAARGTVYHKVMELIYEDGTDDKSFTSFEERLSNLSEWFEYLEEEGRIPKGQIECVNPADIEAFCKSDAGERMRIAMEKGLLHRESPFMMGVSANRIDKELPEDEMVLIQGIIDVWFEEDDGIVLLDYKTDKVKTGDQLVEKYKIQLDLYSEALERITNKKVKEQIIYSFTLGETINL